MINIFCGVIIYFDKSEKQKLDEKKSTSSPIKMILFAKAQIIGGIVLNLIAFKLFLGAIGYFALTRKWLTRSAVKTKKYRHIISI